MSIDPEQHEHYERLKTRIFSNLAVKYFSISSFEKVPSLPKEIGLLKEVEKLYVTRNFYMKEYPVELADLPKLTYISLHFNNLKQIPPVFSQLQHVTELVLSNNPFASSSKWDILTKMPSLQHLNLSYSLQNPAAVPVAICQIKNLISLNISANKITAFPKEFIQLQKLERLFCGTNDFKEFPEIVTQLPNLKELHLPAKSLMGFPDSVLGLQHIPNLVLTGRTDKRYNFALEFERLLKNIKIYQFSPAYQKLILTVMRDSSVISKLSNQQLLSLLNSANTACMNGVLAEMENRIQDGRLGELKMPNAGDKIVIKGELKGKISELKKRLAQNNIEISNKITAATTHILLSAMPGDLVDNLPTSAAILTEQVLVNHLNQLEQPYLLSKTEDNNLAGVRDLLRSNQTENIELALEIIKGGGFPLELLTELFLVYKYTKVQKIKRTIFQIVGQYAPLEFMTALKSRKSISINFSTNEHTLKNNLEYYCSTGNLNKRQIALYLLERGRRGRLFALFCLDTKDKKEYFSKSYSDNIISLSHLELSALPDDFGLVFSEVKSLDISHNKFTSMPPQILDCKKLEIIYIRGVHDVQKWSKDLWKIPSLHTIFIGYNNYWVGAPSGESFVVEGKTVVKK